MNPQEFSWSEDQQVTVTNPTNETYKFKVHNKEYVLGAGKSAKMPGYIAWVYVYGMAALLCQQAGEFMRWNEEGFRQTYYERVVSGVDAVMQDIAVEPEPEIHTFDEQEADQDESEPDEPEQPAETDEPEQPADEEESVADEPTEDESTAPEEPQTPAEDEKPASQVKPMQAKVKAKV